MSKVWWQVVVVMVCAASGILASDVPADLAVDLGSPEVAQGASGPPPASPMSTADRLQAMSAGERSNARLSLEGVEALKEVERQQARQVETLWAEGRHDEAIGLLSQLEAGGARLAFGIAWRQPVASEPKNRGADVRIGAPRVGATDVALDFDRETGNLFAVVNWPSIPNVEWSLNMSSDGGASWSETFFAVSGDLIDAAVVDEFLYVATVYNLQPGHLTMRRFFVADGGLDGSYGSGGAVLVITVFPNTILDIAVGANADELDHRLYCYFIESNNALRYFWTTASGTAWTDNSPPVSNAASSLDFHWSGGTDYFSWITYWGTDGTGHVLGRSRVSTWSAPHTLTGVPSDSRVRVSAYADHVFVSYQYDYGSGQLSADYDVTHNEGASWAYGTAYRPDAGEPGCHGMDITARGGWGTAVVFNREDGAFDSAYVVTREDYAAGLWNPPEAFNEFDALSGAPSFIQYLKPLEAFGVVYLAGSTPETAIPYFDVIGALPFGDGFESGDTSAWSDEVP